MRGKGGKGVGEEFWGGSSSWCQALLRIFDHKLIQYRNSMKFKCPRSVLVEQYTFWNQTGEGKGGGGGAKMAFDKQKNVQDFSIYKL